MLDAETIEHAGSKSVPDVAVVGAEFEEALSERTQVGDDDGFAGVGAFDAITNGEAVDAAELSKTRPR